MEKQWHILRVNVGQEAEVLSRFAQTSYKIYAPTRIMKVFNRKYRAWRKREMPLFPGYMFVKVDHPRHISRGNLIGARGFMRNGDFSYCTLTERELNAVKLLERSLAMPEVASSRHPFKVGDTVKLENDTLSALSAVVARLKGDTELELEVNMLGGIVKMTAGAERLRAA